MTELCPWYEPAAAASCLPGAMGSLVSELDAAPLTVSIERNSASRGLSARFCAVAASGRTWAFAWLLVATAVPPASIDGDFVYFAFPPQHYQTTW